MIRRVTVQYFKWPDDPHWRHELVWLGEDEHGTWLGAPQGAVVQRGSEPALSVQRPFTQLIRSGAWWSLIRRAETTEFPVYVDVATPPVWEAPDRVTLVDLDLDVVRTSGGSVEVLDEDEFEEHLHRHRYPERVVTAARLAAAELAAAIRQRSEPFESVSLSWLGRVLN
jgi:protein associated with RNAse G/E